MQDLEKTLIDNHIRPTAMRLLIMEYFERQSSATDLATLESVFDHADRVTIYRTLKTFEDKGVIHKIIDGSGSAKYALCSPGCEAHDHHDMHVHFTCTVCHGTFCLLQSKISLPEMPPKFEIHDVNLLVTGICEKCN